MFKEKKIVILILVALISIFSYFHYVANEFMESPFADFGHYWIMSSLLKEGHNVWADDASMERRYFELARENGIGAFAKPIHSTGFFVLILPFTFVSFSLALLPWLILSHILLFLAVWLIIKMCRSRPSLEDICIVVFLVFSFFPIREQTHMMQPNFLILFFMSLALYLLTRGSMLMAGISLGLAIQMREYFVLVLLFFIWKKYWRMLAGVIMAVIVLKCLAVFVFGWPAELSYWKYMLGNFGSTVHLSMHNISTAASVHRFLREFIGIPAASVIANLGIVVFIIAAFWWTRKSGIDLLLAFSVFLTLCFLVSPWIHESHFVVLYIPLLVCWFRLRQESRPLYYWLFIVSYLLLGLRYSLIRFPQFNNGFLSIFTLGKLTGLVTFFVLAGMLVRESITLEDSNI